MTDFQRVVLFRMSPHLLFLQFFFDDLEEHCPNYREIWSQSLQKFCDQIEEVEKQSEALDLASSMNLANVLERSMSKVEEMLNRYSPVEKSA